MTQPLAVHPQPFDYYNYYVIYNCVIEEPKPVIQEGYTYEENSVLYCTSATQKGVYCYMYCANSPVMYVDPNGEDFFIFPTVDWSKEGGLSIGLTVGVGIPGLFSASASIGYSTNHKDFSVSIGVSAAFNTVYASYSTQSGFSVGWVTGMVVQAGFPISTNAATIGADYNITNKSFSSNVSSFRWTQGSGWSFDPSFLSLTFFFSIFFISLNISTI